MSDVGQPLFRLSIFCGTCALFATGYGCLLLEPSPPMLFLLAWGPVVGVTMWLTADSKRTRVVRAQDSGLLFYLTWPLTLPWPAALTKTAGVAHPLSSTQGVFRAPLDVPLRAETYLASVLSI